MDSSPLPLVCLHISHVTPLAKNLATCTRQEARYKFLPGAIVLKPYLLVIASLSNSKTSHFLDKKATDQRIVECSGVATSIFLSIDWDSCHPPRMETPHQFRT